MRSLLNAGLITCQTSIEHSRRKRHARRNSSAKNTTHRVFARLSELIAHIFYSKVYARVMRGKKFCGLVVAQLIVLVLYAQLHTKDMRIKLYRANHPYFQYIGRIDFSDPAKPKFWSSGVYIRTSFRRNYCQVILNDEVLYGSFHN